MKMAVDPRFRDYLITLYLKDYDGSNLDACLQKVDLSSRGQMYEISSEAHLYGLENKQEVLNIAHEVREELRSTGRQEKYILKPQFFLHEISSWESYPNPAWTPQGKSHVHCRKPFYDHLP